MKLGDWRRRRASVRALVRAAALAAGVLSLGACASMTQLQQTATKEPAAETPKTPIMLRSIPRHVQFAPVNEWVYLWDRPGGPSARAVRVGRVPSGTEGLIVESEPPRPVFTEFLDAIAADNVTRQPVNWVKVATPRGEGWVRVEFVELR